MSSPRVTTSGFYDHTDIGQLEFYHDKSFDRMFRTSTWQTHIRNYLLCSCSMLQKSCDVLMCLLRTHIVVVFAVSLSTCSIIMCSEKLGNSTRAVESETETDVVVLAPADAASESDDRSKTEASSIDLEWEHEAGTNDVIHHSLCDILNC